MENNAEPQQILDELKKLVILSHRISEIHEYNLTRYPYIVFNGIKNVKIDYDFSRVKTDQDEPELSNSYVLFYLEIEENTQNDFMDKRCSALESYVKTLFWSTTTVEVYQNDKIIFKSKKHER